MDIIIHKSQYVIITRYVDTGVNSGSDYVFFITFRADACWVFIDFQTNDTYILARGAGWGGGGFGI